MSLSMVTLIFSAKYFGVNIEIDICILITTLITIVGSAIWELSMKHLEQNLFSLRKVRMKKMQYLKTTSLVIFIIFDTLLINVALLFFWENLTSIMITSPTHVNTSLFISILIIMIPTLLIKQLTNIGISILDAYEYLNNK